MGVYLGCDVGTVSVKAAVLVEGETWEPPSEDGLTLLEQSRDNGSRVYLTPYRRIRGNPLDAVRELLADLSDILPKEALTGVALTGSGARLASERFGIPFHSEFKSLALGIGSLHPEVNSILEMGGENSKYLRIETHPERSEIGIVDYDTNGDCAAGTGSFMDQQSSRLLYKIEQIGDIVATADRGAKIAGRCSVFAKSDMIHAQQKGASPPQVLRGLCEAVARNFKGNVAKGRELQGKAAFVGGVAHNAGVFDALRRVFAAENGEIFVPEAPAFYSAVGAAMLERQLNGDGKGVTELKVADETVASSGFQAWPRLSLDNVVLLGDKAEPAPPIPDTGEPLETYLGVDIGSVSTNLVLLDKQGRVVHEIYTRTQARPVEVVGQGLKDIHALFGDRIKVCGVGTTGSGRELVGELIGADTINDEITAHKTGAFHIANQHVGKTVDTIFEIGGQDSKYIRMNDGIVVDFTMNEACAAGTGSFLEEQAEKLGVNIIDEFARTAFTSEAPIRLGERCTVYMEMDVTGYLRKGAEKRDVIAGLSYSVVQNYLNRVVRGRSVGDVIFFQGGTAYNHSVAAAFATILDKTVIVPPHNGVMGACGVALLAQEKMEALGEESTFRGFNLGAVDYTVREFTCKACSNQCDIQEFTVEGNKTYWGDKCSEKYRRQVKTDKGPIIEDLINQRAEMLERDWFAAFRVGQYGPENSKLAAKADKWAQKADQPSFAMLRAMYFYDRFPFWHTYLRALGAEVSVTGPTNKRLADAGVEEAVAEPCFPIQVAQGHLTEAAKMDADMILIPSHINAETDNLKVQSHCCPWGQTLPFVLRRSPVGEANEHRIKAPIVHFRDGEMFVEKELWEEFKAHAASRAHHKAAVRLGYAAQQAFNSFLRKKGLEALEAIEKAGEIGIVLIGRPYNIYDGGMNLNLPSKLRKQYGVNVIPLDFLPTDEAPLDELNPNMYWGYGRKILRTALWTSNHPHLHGIYVTNFKCGPDSFVKTFAADGAGKPYLTLQFDGHGNDAGMMTRCEAYLDSKGFLRWWTRQETSDKTH